MAPSRVLLALVLLPACSTRSYDNLESGDDNDDPETQGGSFEITLSELQPSDFAGSSFADLSVPGEARFAADHEGAPDDGAGFRLTRTGVYRMTTGEGEGDESTEFLSFAVEIQGFEGGGEYPARVSLRWRGDRTDTSQPTVELLRDACLAAIADDTLGGTVTCHDAAPHLLATWHGHGVHFE